MNPLSGFYAAVTRKSPDGRSPHGTDGWLAVHTCAKRLLTNGVLQVP